MRDSLAAFPQVEMKLVTCILGEVLNGADEFVRSNLIEFDARKKHLLSPPIVVGMLS